jgi:hypothetical protein
MVLEVSFSEKLAKQVPSGHPWSDAFEKKARMICCLNS